MRLLTRQGSNIEPYLLVGLDTGRELGETLTRDQSTKDFFEQFSFFSIFSISRTEILHLFGRNTRELHLKLLWLQTSDSRRTRLSEV